MRLPSTNADAAWLLLALMMFGGGSGILWSLLYGEG